MNDNKPVSKKPTNEAASVDDHSTQEISQAQKDLNTIRHIINSEALAVEELKRKQQAREYVTEVVSEALNDRQQSDNSVSKIMVPIVEQAIEKSISQQRDKFIDFLYPLVGDLVRNFATAFFRDFIEKTNELIENSITVKSMKWRYQAWRSGVPFSRYVASQVYAFQTQQVLLIHKETGILLNSVSLNLADDENSDLVSSMLTAISDFVNDSFSQNKGTTPDGKSIPETKVDNQGLHEIRTNEFVLYVKQGPQAMLVAAVTGNISPIAKDKFQSTLEQIHAMYLPQLQTFDGDTTLFAPTYSDLSDCLLAEEKSETKAKKKPWPAIAFLLLVFGALAYYFFLSWQTSQLADEIYALPKDQGIVVNKNEVVGLQQIELTVLRDPSAISIKEWMTLGSITEKQRNDWILVTEIPFVSLSEGLVQRRLGAFIDEFNTKHSVNAQANQTNTELRYDLSTNTISGQLSSTQNIIITAEIAGIEGIKQLAPQMDINVSENTQSDHIISQRALTLLSGNISQLQIAFGSNSAQITELQSSTLNAAVDAFKQLQTFANELDLSAKLLVLGASDNLGSARVNQALSIKRAENTADALVSLGIARTDIMTSGLGIIEDAPPNTNVRKAIIHVILTKL